MYAGTTLTKWSGAVFGAHQKIDRVARHNLDVLLVGRANGFPRSQEILRFEGKDGPDGIKRKTPAQGEPWHYFDPYDPKDNGLVVIIEYHYKELTKALKDRNRARASFEAAWLSHAIVDGLTPAHHYPYEAELTKLRGGEGIETRTSVKEKLIMHGDTRMQQLGNNWKMWGPKGLLTTHGLFEFGVASIIAPLKLTAGRPSDEDLAELVGKGLPRLFREKAIEIADKNMYIEFYKRGWTVKLARQVRRELAPMIVDMVTLAWYGALRDSQETTKK
ncbi:MAG: hypothetical protein ABI220_01360 [Candidatus Saccharimonadales bacterium]